MVYANLAVLDWYSTSKATVGLPQMEWASTHVMVFIAWSAVYSVVSIQTGTAIPDWDDYYYRPEYLKPSDPRLNLFQFGGGDKAAHFGMLFDVLLNANSPLLKEIADKGYRIKVLEAVMGRSGPE